MDVMNNTRLRWEEDKRDELILFKLLMIRVVTVNDGHETILI
jgi:hypothetical protein